MNSDTKPAVQSLTMWGSVAGLLGMVLPALLVRFHAVADQGAAVTLAGQIIGVIGAAVALYGRYQATTPLQGIIRSPKS